MYRRNKYHAQKLNFDGNTFDSMKEYRRWLVLKLMEKEGKITGLQRQVKFLLIPSQREPDTVGKRGGIKKGKLLEREIAYYADFVYKTADGVMVVEDTKGIRTTEYVIKRKMMLYFHGVRIREV